MTDGALVPAIAGLVTGILFIILLSMSVQYLYPEYLGPINPKIPDEENYTPLLQLKIMGLKEQYKTGETIDFSVVHKAGGCRYPETIWIKDSESGTIVWQFDGTSSKWLLFCPIIANPADYTIRWQTRDNLEQPITINQAGSYVIIVKHLHMTVRQNFVVIS